MVSTRPTAAADAAARSQRMTLTLTAHHAESAEPFDERRPRLHDVALRVAHGDEVALLKRRFTELGVVHSEIKVSSFGSPMITLPDPDNVQLEVVGGPESPQVDRQTDPRSSTAQTGRRSTSRVAATASAAPACRRTGGHGDGRSRAMVVRSPTRAPNPGGGREAEQERRGEDRAEQQCVHEVRISCVRQLARAPARSSSSAITVRSPR